MPVANAPGPDFATARPGAIDAVWAWAASGIAESKALPPSNVARTKVWMIFIGMLPVCVP
jgi:hypothetical protein